MQNGITFKRLSVDNENNVYGKVPNGTNTFLFLNEIEKSDTAEYSVYLDIICSQEAKSKTVNLVTGDNTFYIYVEKTDEDEVLYTVTIRVKPLYEVVFNSNGGTSVAMQTIEEDAFATIPTTEPTKTGYIFKGWDFDFETPITNDIMVNAIWQIDNDFAIFNFTSTISTCEITGIKDKTVTEIIVPNNVTSINQGAFSGCSKLESITLPFVGDKIHNSTDTYQYPFGYIFGTNSYTGGVATIQYYYGSSTSSTTSTTYYIPNTLKSVTITGGNILYRAFYNCSSLTSVTIGDSVESIGEDAFQYCSSLTSVEIPNSVTSIGNYAFYNCISLTSVVIGDTVTSIGEDAFYGCNKLIQVINKSNLNITSGSSNYGDVGYYAKQIITDKSQSRVIEKDDYIFYNDNGTYYLMGYKGTDTELVLPNDINGNNYSIYKYAFYNCSSLTSIEIPNSVTSIGSYAFRYCSSLTSITYQGTTEEWNAIAKGSFWNDGTRNYIIHCTNGDINK